MDSLNSLVREYTAQLEKGRIQKAYKGIMAFMSRLGTRLSVNYPDHSVGALYFGYMDMTYFAFTPSVLKDRKLKIAIVYVHEAGRFEGWLGAGNRKIQAEQIERMAGMDLGKYALSHVQPGVDSIIETILVGQPDFDHPDALMSQIEEKAVAFARDMAAIVQ